MPSHVALLRGINVGGNNRVAMPALREAVSALGHTDVSTYIQSGNVVFTPAAPTEPAALAAQLEQAVDDAFGTRPRIAVVSRGGLARTIEQNPYAVEPNPKYLHAVFFGDPPGAELAAFVESALEAARAKGSLDEAMLVDDVLYLHTPAGLGRSDLAAQFGKVRGPLHTKGSGTARNWSTVTTLLRLCG